MLQPLKAHGVSMTRFESRPARSGQWEYYFYVDIDGHPDQPNVALALAGAARGVRVLQAARHLPRRLALAVATLTLDVRTTRRDRLRPDGRLVRARDEARRLVAASSATASRRRRPSRRSGSASSTPPAESALLAVSGSDIVLIAVPVSATEATFKAIRHLIEPALLVMDVGSTKRDVVDAAPARPQGPHRSFVPAHPIAGKEVAGIATPTPRSTRAAR
jgi:hypothetical protein